MTFNPKQVRGVLFDLDGTLTVDWRPLDGAIATLEFLRRRGIPYRICTNTTTLSAASLARRLSDSGLPVAANEVFSAPTAAVGYLRQRRLPSCRLLLGEDTRRDFSEFVDDPKNPSAIVIGDIGNGWNYELMQSLFEQVMGGAEMIALHKGKYWLAQDKLWIDIGAFVSGLEYATRRKALVIGKPSREFFSLALANLGLAPEQAIMVGDDLDNDIAGANNAGIASVLVMTGKNRADVVTNSTVSPTIKLSGVGEMPQLLES